MNVPDVLVHVHKSNIRVQYLAQFVSDECLVQDRIGRLEAERLKLVESLHGTHLDLKSFVPLLVKYAFHLTRSLAWRTLLKH